MRTKNYSGNILKTTLLTFILCAASTLVSAQTSTPTLEGPALEKAVYLNKQSGLPAYHNIYAQYTITADQAEVLSKYYDQLMADIKRIKDVIDCSIDIQNSRLTVKFPAENAKDNREQNLEKVKSAMALYNVKFVSYTEGTYHN